MLHKDVARAEGMVVECPPEHPFKGAADYPYPCPNHLAGCSSGISVGRATKYRRDVLSIDVDVSIYVHNARNTVFCTSIYHEG